MTCRARSLAACAAATLMLGAAGCSLLNQSYRCAPAPGPDEPDPETPDTIVGSAAADTTSRLPCEWDARPGLRSGR